VAVKQSLSLATICAEPGWTSPSSTPTPHPAEPGHTAGTRCDCWKHQVEIIGIEIEQIERQILAAHRVSDIALRELNNHQQQIEHSAEVADFLRGKFTGFPLYLHLQRETAALYRQLYEVAVRTGQRAQLAFNYERGHTTRSFLPVNGWDDLHEGLLAGERLQLALRQTEGAYLDANCREYELTKHISLRQDFPLAFLHLQHTGYTEIQLPEWLFDLDYPGPLPASDQERDGDDPVRDRPVHRRTRQADFAGQLHQGRSGAGRAARGVLLSPRSVGR
jgi:hypothetical protein